MKTNRWIISYATAYTILYLITFFVVLVSSESFYSLKLVVLINGLAILGTNFIDRKLRLKYFHPFFYFVISYILIFAYNYINNKQPKLSFVDYLNYPFTDGFNGLMFVFLFAFFNWIICIFIDKLIKRKNNKW